MGAKLRAASSENGDQETAGGSRGRPEGKAPSSLKRVFNTGAAATLTSTKTARAAGESARVKVVVASVKQHEAVYLPCASSSRRLIRVQG
jgi:hypothetical protein